MRLGFGETFEPKNYADPRDQSRAQAYVSYAKGELTEALVHWRQFPQQALDANDLRLVAECMAEEGKDEALEAIEQLRQIFPVEADAVLGRFYYRRGQFEKATEILEKTFVEFRTDPWPNRDLTERTLQVAQYMVDKAESDLLRLRLYHALGRPFSVFKSDETRRTARLRLAMEIEKDNFGEFTLAALEPEEPNVPWGGSFLRTRAACYKAVGSPRLAQAERDLREFNAEQPAPMGELVFSKQIPVEGAPKALKLSSTH